MKTLALALILIMGGTIMHNSEEVVLQSPVKGAWTIYNPPGHAPLAFDLLAVDDKKSLYAGSSFFSHFVSFIDVKKSLTWDQPVYAPATGKVVAVLNNVPDRMWLNFPYDLVSLGLNKPDPADGFGVYGGNYILIAAKEGYYVLLCHLKEGSVLVKEGDQLTAGALIAAVGNSGSSIQPHLHLQVMKDRNIFPLFKNLIPFAIESGEVEHKGSYGARSDIKLENRGYYRFNRSDIREQKAVPID